MTNKRIPDYIDKADYNTNSPSYYHDLARKQKLIQLLAERIWEYDERLDNKIADLEEVLSSYLSQWDERIENLDDEVSHIFVTWLNNGTLEQIINHDVLGNKADKSYVDNLNENVTRQLAKKATKGKIEQIDLNKNYFALDASWFLDSFLQDLSNGEINTTFLERGSVTTDKIANRAVTPVNTDFMDISTNLVNERDTFHGSHTALEGGIGYRDDYSSERGVKVSPNTSYSTYAYFRVHFFDDGNNQISYQGLEDTGDSFITPENCVSIDLVYINTMYSPDPAQRRLNKGSTLLPYEPFYEILDPDYFDMGKMPKIEAKHTDFIDVSTNLASRESEKHGQFINAEGSISYSPSNYSMTDFIGVEPSTQYKTFIYSRVTFHDENNNFIGTKALTNGGESDFNTPANCVKVILNYDHNLPNANERRLNEGNQLLPFEPFYERLKPEITIHNEPNQLKDSDFIFPPDTIENDLVLKDVTRNDQSLNELYDNFDNLILNNSDYVSKTVYGKDATGTHDVIKIDLQEPEAQTETLGLSEFYGKKPKVVFIGSIHGTEKMPGLASYYFTKALCEDWKTDSRLEYLRHNIDFSFIPVANPWGYVNQQYTNSNDINLLYNLPYRHTVYDESDVLYGGEEPLSEIEAQYIKQLIDENKDRAVFFVDMHDFGGYVENFDAYVDSMFYYLIAKRDGYSPEIDLATKYGVEKNTRFLKKEYDYTNDKFLGYVYARDRGGSPDSYASSLGVPSMLFEINSNTPGNPIEHNSEAIKIATELLINNFLITLKTFKES